jgi:autotransporter-associated beta strand protein
MTSCPTPAMNPSRWASLLACLVPVLHASEWNAGEGNFGSAVNWVEGSVPSGGTTAVSIANGGSASIDPAGSYTIGALMLGNHSGEGSIAQSGGCLNARRIIIGGDDSSGGSGVGFYRIDEGTLRSVADEIWIGSKGGQGSLQLGGSSLVSSASWVVVGRDGASGELRLSGSAQLEVLSGNLPVGCNSSGHTSVMEVSGSARVNAANEIWIGWLGDNSNRGILNLSGHASLSSGSGFVVGRSGASGRAEVTEDSSLDVGGHLVCGADPGSQGEMIIRDEAHVHAGKQVLLGLGGAGGIITVNGGCLTGHAAPGEDASGAGISFRGNGVLSVNGGKVSTPGFSKTAGSARVIVNGGTVRATGATSGGGFFAGFSDEDLWIGPGGMTFDTKALTIEIEQSLRGEGKLSKRGTGSLVIKGSDGHAGDTEISQGRLTLLAPLLSDAQRVLISGTGSRLQLTHAQVDRVAKLVIDGVVQPAGRYEAPGSPGDGTEIAQIEGTGALEVRFGPADLSFADWIAGHEPANGFDADTDGDGISNGVEQVFGSDPNATTALPLLEWQEDGVALMVHPLAATVAADVDYYYEWSRDLGSWQRGGEADATGMRVDITRSPVTGGIRVRYEVSSGSSQKLFGRVVARQVSDP